MTPRRSGSPAPRAASSSFVVFTCTSCGKEVRLAYEVAQKAGLTCSRSDKGVDHKPARMERAA